MSQHLKALGSPCSSPRLGILIHTGLYMPSKGGLVTWLRGCIQDQERSSSVTIFQPANRVSTLVSCSLHLTGRQKFAQDVRLAPSTPSRSHFGLVCTFADGYSIRGPGGTLQVHTRRRLLAHNPGVGRLQRDHLWETRHSPPPARRRVPQPRVRPSCLRIAPRTMDGPCPPVSVFSRFHPQFQSSTRHLQCQR